MDIFPRKTVQPFEPFAPKFDRASTVILAYSNAMELVCIVVIKKIALQHTHRRTNRLIESIDPGGRCFENFFHTVQQTTKQHFSRTNFLLLEPISILSNKTFYQDLMADMAEIHMINVIKSSSKQTKKLFHF